MAAQVEVQTGEVGRAGMGGRLHLSPLTDSSNKSLTEGPSSTHGSLIIASEPTKPVPGPKPRLTPKPFAVEKNPCIRPILAPKPQTKPRPEPTFPAGYKPILPGAPKPQQPAVTAKTRPVSTNANRPSPTSFKPSSKQGQTNKPVVHPFKPAPPLSQGDPSRPTPPKPAERQKPGVAGQSYLNCGKKAPAAEWSGSTRKEEEKKKAGSSHGSLVGTSMTRAKSMGFLSQMEQEEKQQEAKPEAAVALRPQPRSSRPRPVSAIFIPPPSKLETATPSPRWEGRRPLSADLTAKFESIGLSLHRKQPKADSKENTPEEGGLRKPEGGSERTATMTLQGTDSVAKPVVSVHGKEKKDEKEHEKENGDGSIKRWSSLLLDSSATIPSSPEAGAGGQGQDPCPGSQPIPEHDAPLGIKQRIKKLTEDTPPVPSPPAKLTVKPRPLPLDLTKRFASERSVDLCSPSFIETADNHETDQDPQKRVEDSMFKLGDQSDKVEDGRNLQEQHSPAVKASTEGVTAGSSSRHSSEVQTVRASLFENIVERHSVLVLDGELPKKGCEVSQQVFGFEDPGTCTGPAPPSSPRRVVHSFETVQGVEASRVVSESVPAALLEDKAMTLRSKRSEGNRPAGAEPAPQRGVPVQGEPALAPTAEQQPRYLRVGALQKWNTEELDNEAGAEKGWQREMERALERDEQKEAEGEEVAAAPKRLKMLETEDQPKPRATYFALTGQMQEPVSRGDAGEIRRETTDTSSGDFSVRSGDWGSQGKIVPPNRNPSLDETFGKNPQDSKEGEETLVHSMGPVWDRKRMEEGMEIERQRELRAEADRQKERKRELEREKQRQREIERQQHLEFARMKERERQREFERQRQKEFEKEKCRELERQKQIQLEKEKQLELERERLRELERERQRQLEREKQHKLEKRRNQERQKELDKERKLLEIQAERQHLEELERIKEMERRQLFEFERQKRMETERQQMMELEKQRLKEEAEKLRQMAIQQEVDRQRELERKRLKEMEKERLAEMERQRDLERERQRQLDFERQELEKQKLRQRELEIAKELERRQLLEFENQRQLEKERQQLMELEKKRLKERMEREEADKLRLVAKQQEAERQRLRERQKREAQEWTAVDSSPLKPKVLDLDSVLRDDPFSEAPSHQRDPSTRWKQPSPRAEEPYKLAILDIDSFSSQTQPLPNKEAFPTTGFQVLEAGGRVQYQPLTPEMEGINRVPLEPLVVRPSPVWVHSPQDPWELKSVEMSVDRPANGFEPARKAVGKPVPEQPLLHQGECHPERHCSGLLDDPIHMRPLPSRETNTAIFPGRGSGSTPQEQVWYPREPEPQGRSPRRSLGSQLSRMRSRSVSRRSAPSDSSTEVSLSRMRSRSAHRERDHHSWVQQRQSVSGEDEVKDTDTLVHESDSQYGTWETGLRTDDSLTPATPTSDSPLSPSPIKPTPPYTLGQQALSDPDTPDGFSPPESQPLAFPEVPAALLDTSALRSRAQLAKKRAPRSRPSRAARQGTRPLEGGAVATEDWRYRDSTEASESKQEDSDSEEQTKIVDPRSASQPQRIPLFPGMDPSALKSQLKKRADSDAAVEGAAPSPSQLSRSPKSPFLPRAARVLPPAGLKENGAEDSPQWLRELKSKKRLSQYENDDSK